MKKAEIQDGVVINVIEVEAGNVPDWCVDWPELHGLAGIGWTITDSGEFMPPDFIKEAATIVRKQRDQLLTDSDWTQMPDAPVDQAAWATYRQALRDIPQQAGFPTDITWPTKPE